ncbi:phosphoribosylaminoimidazolesuccinocarboxamide synthase [Neohortaea acidophila]|uniref:Phosphoribosylaminoimidazole-succinocarboxamide synthase n=1 Tax=Neohortaea acidophila TaxID=245834 RepID=A0A6A6Q241_9PEZI|nr:phosphoribosylaminoimidazolesuccinocarboxamide synthase [Neohortaea acidophila]KAF2486049.1 phosphoribosylaminoimidazolesuccinocarboxamide synthase [Neohortaea acidophila]
MEQTDTTITDLDLTQYGLKKIASGKVRELYEIDSDTLLFVATDRISAYDVILANGIPGKGALLTQLSAHWFSLIQTHLPTLRTHLLPTPTALPPSLPRNLSTRSMLVQRLKIIPLESIVRGYITGSAWAEYKTHGTVHGVPVPSGLQESQKFDTPVWTPSTKAPAGEHDENISPTQAAALVGKELAGRIEDASLKVYQMAHDYAAARGIIIADTKFEFGLDEATNELVLVDEVLTPDSSRFWPADRYEIGRGQQSYDKQPLRDWLTSSGLKGKEGVRMPEEVVRDTEQRYREAYERLTGEKHR